jgi:putative transposase
MDALARRAYPSDLTEAQWTILEPLIPAGKRGGRPRKVNMREVINTILYLNRSGCQWDMLPQTVAPKPTRISLPSRRIRTRKKTRKLSG